MTAYRLILTFIFLSLKFVLLGQTLPCSIKTNKTIYKKGEVPSISVEIKNNTDSTIRLVKALDKSRIQKRFPYAYFKIEMVSDTSYKMRTYGECGNWDNIDSTDFIEVKPNETFDPYKYQSPVYYDYAIKDPRNFEKTGKYKITFYYSTNESHIAEWLGDHQSKNWFDWNKHIYLPGKEREFNKLIALLKLVPKVELVSNELIIEIK